MTSTLHDIDDALVARIQRALADAHGDVLAEPEPLQRRIRLRGAIAALLAEQAGDGVAPAAIVQSVSDRVVGLGSLEPFLRDPDVTEIMVNGPRAVFVERAGRLEPVPVRFDDDDAVRRVIERIIAPLGLRIDGSQPFVDARLGDGSRVHAMLPPLTPGGPTLTIRRFARTHHALADFATPGVVAALDAAVRTRRNLLVVGGTGTGKTSLLRALCERVPGSQRLITIEDTAELAPTHPHVVSLEARPANADGRGAVTIRDLVRQALRMRPDRLIVGEVRGVEVVDMLAAMNTGHQGSMATAHANSAAEVVARIEAMAAGSGLSAGALRRLLGAALDLVIDVERGDQGRRVRGLYDVVAERGRVQLRLLEAAR